MINTSELKELIVAFSKARAEFPPIPLNATAKIVSSKGSYSYDYTTLDKMIDLTVPVLAANGLSVTQITVPSGEASNRSITRTLRNEGSESSEIENITKSTLITILMHVSGQSIQSVVDLPYCADAKIFGGVMKSYRRYQYAAILGIASDEEKDPEQAETPRPAAAAAPVSRPASALSPDIYVTQDQIKLLMVTCQDCAVTEDELKDLLASINLTTRKKILRNQLNSIMQMVKDYAAARDVGEPISSIPPELIGARI